MRWIVSETKFFASKSREYMAGMNPTLFDWIRAYLRFMYYVTKDKLNRR